MLGEVAGSTELRGEAALDVHVVEGLHPMSIAPPIPAAAIAKFFSESMPLSTPEPMSSTEFEKLSSFLLDCSASSPASWVARFARSCAASSCFSEASSLPVASLCFRRACSIRSSAASICDAFALPVAELLQLLLFDGELGQGVLLCVAGLRELAGRGLDCGLRLRETIRDAVAELLPGLLPCLLHLWPQLLRYVPADARHHRHYLDRAPTDRGRHSNCLRSAFVAARRTGLTARDPLVGELRALLRGGGAARVIDELRAPRLAGVRALRPQVSDEVVLDRPRHAAAVGVLGERGFAGEAQA
ncbi:hypothetical protein GS909_07130 [Rhodococcus hoagii]|nr:hypothetical protein [Prescottella equi]